MKRPEYFSRDKIKQEIARLEYNPDDLAELQKEAEQHVKNKDWIEALYILDKIIEDYGATARLYLNKSICQYRLQEYEEALESLDLALVEQPEFIEALTMKTAIEQKIANLRKYYGVNMYG